MAKPGDIIEAMQAVLEAAAVLSYIKDVYQGERQAITNFPCIFIEPLQNVEQEFTFPQQEMTLTLNITACVDNRNFDKQIVGDSREKGILDIENDIKAALSDITLGGLSHNLTFTNTRYEKGDVRIAVIECVVSYRQNATTRE